MWARRLNCYSAHWTPVSNYQTVPERREIEKKKLNSMERTQLTAMCAEPGAGSTPFLGCPGDRVTNAPRDAFSPPGFHSACPPGAQQERLRDLPALSEFHTKLWWVLLWGPGPSPPSSQRVHHAPGPQVHRQLCRLLLRCPSLQWTELWNEPLPGLARLLGVRSQDARHSGDSACACIHHRTFRFFSFLFFLFFFLSLQI